MKLKTALIAAVCMNAVASCALNQYKPTFDGYMVTRDNTKLRTVVYLPKSNVPGPYPTIVMRTPYGAPKPPPGGLTEGEIDDDDDAGAIKAWEPFLEKGYAVVQQTTRGRLDSFGYDTIFSTEREDGADLAKWIDAQSWSNGKMVVVGDSADGFVGWMMLASGEPGIRAGYFQASCGNLLKDGVVREFGGLQMETLVPWLTNMSEEYGPDVKARINAKGITWSDVEQSSQTNLAPFFSEDPDVQARSFTSTSSATLQPLASISTAWPKLIGEDEYEERSRYFDTSTDIDVPVLQVGLWDDAFLDCTLNQHVEISKRRDDHKVLILDGSHYDIDSPSIWPVKPFEAWLDRHLKADRSIDDILPATITSVSSRSEGEYRIDKYEKWPPQSSRNTEMFLQADGLQWDGLDVVQNIGKIQSRPESPVPNIGGRNLLLNAGKFDQSMNLSRDDVLYLQGPALSESMTLMGPVSIDLIARSSAQNADIVAILVRVGVDGEKQLLAENLFRMRYKDGRSNPAPLEPYQEYPISFEIGHVHDHIKAGESLGIILQPSNAPRWDLAVETDSDPSLGTLRETITTEIITRPDQPAKVSFWATAG